MKTTNTETNIVRLSKGERFVRFEIARGCTVATRHDGAGRAGTLDLDEARSEIARLRDAGWTVAAV